MGRVEGILAAVSAIVLATATAGCAAKHSKNTATLTPPTPAVAPAVIKPKEQLSIPQTQVQLPPLQPLNMEALDVPAAPTPEPPTPAPKPVRRTTPVSPPPAKPEVTAPAAQPAEPERPPIQEIVPADERKRFQDSADARKRETRQLLEQAKTRRLTNEQKKMRTRILSFVAQSDDAEKHGDMRQADALAERGLVLAKELAGGQ